MRKNIAKLLFAATTFTVACTALPLSGEAITAMQEKPLAGITVSFDRYCENVMESAAEDEKKAEAEEKAQETETPSRTEASSESTTKTSEKTEKKKEKQIKLNLKYDKLGVADVDSYLNVRKGRSEGSKIVGKMTKNTGCNIVSIKKGWAKIESGKVKGYVKAKYLLKGDAAEKKALKVATLKAIVKTETLNVRYLPSTDSQIYDQISEDEYYTVEKENLSEAFVKRYIEKHCSKKAVKGVDKDAMYDDLKNWVMLSIDDEKVFVSKDFIGLKYKLNRAVTIKSVKKQKKDSSSSSSSSSSKAGSLVDYAMQFLGNRYVWGGTSLTNGTDCSGFTMGIYAHFGYSLPRTSAAQAAATRSVSSGDVQVGDLFFYGSGSVSHVAMYIGNGQIIHASNARDGIKISSAYYRQPLKIGRVM